MLEALLLFLDFPPRLPLLFAALLPAAAPKRTPFTGLDFPAEVHREDEQDDHADDRPRDRIGLDRKSTRLNSSHLGISYAVFCLKKKTNIHRTKTRPTSHSSRDKTKYASRRQSWTTTQMKKTGCTSL